MNRTIRMGLIVGVVVVLSASTPRVAEAQFCYKCDLEYFPFTCTYGNPAFDPITGNYCQFIPGQWCWVSGSCFSESASNTFVKESATVSFAGFFPGTDPRYLSACAGANKLSPGLVLGGRRPGVIASLRKMLLEAVS